MSRSVGSVHVSRIPTATSVPPTTGVKSHETEPPVIVPLEGVAASARLHVNPSAASRPATRTWVGILDTVDRFGIGATRGKTEDSARKLSRRSTAYPEGEGVTRGATDTGPAICLPPHKPAGLQARQSKIREVDDAPISPERWVSDFPVKGIAFYS